MLLLVAAMLASAAALTVPSTSARVEARSSVVRMDSNWRPKTVDPLGKAFGVKPPIERSYDVWLDLRTAENTFAQMVVMKLFYSVRRVVDEAGTSLPYGSAVQGLLFDEMRYDRADTIGQNTPIFVQAVDGSIYNATAVDGRDELPAALQSPTTVEELEDVGEELERAGSSSEETVAAMVLPADAMMWACALTGMAPTQLKPLKANEGA